MELTEYESMVYFFLHRKYNAVKIGYTSNVDERLSDIRTGCPVHSDIKLLFWFRGSREEETEFHRRFRMYRMDGEWFALEGELKDFVGECMAITRGQRLGGVPLWRERKSEI